MWFLTRGNNSWVKNESRKYTLVYTHMEARLAMVKVNFFEAGCREAIYSSSLVHGHKTFQWRSLKNINHAMFFPKFIAN